MYLLNMALVLQIYRQTPLIRDTVIDLNGGESYIQGSKHSNISYFRTGTEIASCGVLGGSKAIRLLLAATKTTTPPPPITFS